MLTNPLPATLGEVLLNSIQTFPNRDALIINEVTLTYKALFRQAYPLIQVLLKQNTDKVALLVERNAFAYISIAACALAGKTYMPLPRSGVARLAYMLNLSDTRTVIVDNEHINLLSEVLNGVNHSINIIKISDRLSCQMDEVSVPYAPETLSADVPAYIMFTSGSTGSPKAVEVGQKEVMYYLEAAKQLFKPDEADRFSQVIELTFDLSVHDIFLCWSVGACLCVYNEPNFLKLSTYIIANQLTFWLSVPTTGAALDMLRQLKPNYYTSLRVVLFCGEPLPDGLAKKWAESASHANVYNIYGPTEATIAFTSYCWQPSLIPKSPHEIVPIGYPISGLSLKIVNEFMCECPTGTIGEIMLGGPQVVNGYLNLPEQTAARFLQLSGVDGYWYRTGDLGLQDDNGCIFFKGRVDDQLQIRGQRSERIELETDFKNVLGIEHLAVIPSPITKSGLVLGVALIYIKNDNLTDELIRKACNKNFSPPIKPTAYIAVESFPLNNSGKVDYKSLCHRYQTVEERNDIYC